MENVIVKYLHCRVLIHEGKTIIQPILDTKQDCEDLLLLLKPNALNIWVDNYFRNNLRDYMVKVFEYQTQKPYLLCLH